jgi:hypothetical protein
VGASSRGLRPPGRRLGQRRISARRKRANPSASVIQELRLARLLISHRVPRWLFTGSNADRTRYPESLQTLPRDTELLAFEAGLAPPERAGHGSPQASARRKRLTAKNQTTDRIATSSNASSQGAGRSQPTTRATAAPANRPAQGGGTPGPDTRRRLGPARVRTRATRPVATAPTSSQLEPAGAAGSWAWPTWLTISAPAAVIDPVMGRWLITQFDSAPPSALGSWRPTRSK